jgi:hypothetical protein
MRQIEGRFEIVDETEDLGVRCIGSTLTFVEGIPFGELSDGVVCERFEDP